MALTLITAPAKEPVSLDEARAQVRGDGDDDADIEIYLAAARQQAETYTRLALITQTWQLKTDCLGREVLIPKRPVQAVVSVKYLDQSGVEQTLDTSAYRVITRDTGDTVIVPSYGAIWPAVYPVEAAVTVRFTAGFGDEGDTVPSTVRQAIKLMLSHWYANREAVDARGTAAELPLGVEALLFPHRVFY